MLLNSSTLLSTKWDQQKDRGSVPVIRPKCVGFEPFDKSWTSYF